MARTYEPDDGGALAATVTGAGDAATTVGDGLAAQDGHLVPGAVVAPGGDTAASEVVAEGGAFWADGAGDLGAETAELIAQIRQLASHDPAGVQQVVADVLSALDRATDGAVRDGLPDGSALADGMAADAGPTAGG